MTTKHQQLETQKYLELQQFVQPELLKVLCEYLWFNQQQRNFTPNDKHRAFVLSHEPVLDVVLDYFAIVFSQHIGKKLLPTYGFSRIYYQGADLRRHIDRPACEVSCTFPLGYSDDNDWPIYVAIDKDNLSDKADLIGKPMNLKLGDMMLYKGEQLYHWREKLEKKWQAQLFLHYVYADGDNTDHQFDKRGNLLMTLERLSILAPEQRETRDSDQLDSDEIAEQLADFLKKQLLILKTIRVVKKFWLPTSVVIAGAVVLAFVL